MSIEKNPNHIQDGIDRLIEQYKTKPNIEGMLNAIIQQIQDLEDINHDLFTSRTILSAVGIQLDKMGEIVGQDRAGFDDDFYRILLIARVGINVSNGEYERVIDVFKILTQSLLVHLQEWYPAGYGITADNEIDNDLIRFIFNLMKLVDPAGVRIEGIMCFNGDAAFAIAGGPGVALGLGDALDLPFGGQLGFIHETAAEFAIDGEDISGEGLGDILDPVAGGALI